MRPRVALAHLVCSLHLAALTPACGSSTPPPAASNEPAAVSDYELPCADYCEKTHPTKTCGFAQSEITTCTVSCNDALAGKCSAQTHALLSCAARTQFSCFGNRLVGMGACDERAKAAEACGR